jgi:hypothetical protein
MSPPDIKSAEQITEWLREIVRSARHSPLQKTLVLLALLSFAAAWLVRGDQAKQFGSYWLKDDWQRISESASLILGVRGQGRKCAGLKSWSDEPGLST